MGGVIGIVGTAYLKTSGAPYPLYGVDENIVRDLSTAFGGQRRYSSINGSRPCYRSQRVDSN